jgi:hypothetical protein
MALPTGCNLVILCWDVFRRKGVGWNIYATEPGNVAFKEGQV